jgi:hypothetical protein
VLQLASVLSRRGILIDIIRKHANWSLNADTFEKYYTSPGQALTSAKINASIFSASEKRIRHRRLSELGTTTNPTSGESHERRTGGEQEENGRTWRRS